MHRGFETKEIRTRILRFTNNPVAQSLGLAHAWLGINVVVKIEAAWSAVLTFETFPENLLWQNVIRRHHARVRIIYVEASVSKLHRQNKDRAEVVPGAAISRMMDRWEVPTAIEADAVEWWIEGGAVGNQYA